MNMSVYLRASAKALSRESYRFPLKTKKRLCAGYRLRVRLLKENIMAYLNAALVDALRKTYLHLQTSPLAHIVSSGVYLTRNHKKHVLLYIQGWIKYLEQTLPFPILIKSGLEIRKTPDFSGVLTTYGGAQTRI